MSKPPSYRLRPVAALRAMRKLLRNREETQQVFLLIEALRGKTTLRQFARFRQTETGRAVLRENRRLLDRLSDRERNREIHDLLHVVTGYGRDPLGEACLVAFSYAQTGLKGFAVIAAFVARRIARSRPGQPVRRAVFEGYRHGRSAGWLPGADWEALLAHPVQAIRAQFAIKPPTYYRTILAAVSRLEGEASAGYADSSVQLSS